MGADPGQSGCSTSHPGAPQRGAPRFRRGSVVGYPVPTRTGIVRQRHFGAHRGDAALSMVSGMAWLWFVNSDFAEGPRWLACALGAEGERRAELHATALAWHGYCVGMSFSLAAAVVDAKRRSPS